MFILLSRNNFRKNVFTRDNHKCVFCEQPAVDAHHIIERRLWPNGGYYLENGASVCEKHHLECEKTIISVEEVREKCNITKFPLPPHLYNDQIYDKWGNIILPNGQRLRGDLFYDESVQKILGQTLQLFTFQAKYPRTYHLPWSKGLDDDDRMMSNVSGFEDEEISITEKMDGENTTMYSNYIHARSIDSRNHISREWVKNFWSKICYEIPEGWRICGENMYAKHSILYDNLPSYFLGFSIWNNKNECLSWDDTLEWFELLGIIPVKEIYRGMFNQQKIEEATKEITQNLNLHEGYVIRVTKQFPISKFRYSVGKYVRKGHIQTSKHWMRGQPLILNKVDVL